ncbi:MAG: hypothetical protein IT204_21505 [Fimbriimonadaceae bacterium]|nr:hypothetical protein [Fimbriimonadaceae bacterium]
MVATSAVPALNEHERAVLRVLRDRGPMSPTLLAARLLRRPADVLALLADLAARGLLIVLQDPSTIDGQLVIPTVLGKRGVKRLV